MTASMMEMTATMAPSMPTVMAIKGAKRWLNTSVGTVMMNDHSVPATGAKDMTRSSPALVVQLMTKLSPAAMLRRMSSTVTPSSMRPASSVS